MNWLKDCPVQFKPHYFRRYVDDIFLLFDERDKIKKFWRYLNSKHKNIKFTYEEEENDVLSFLDIKITRINGKFCTSIYRKKTFSGVYLNYESFLPITYKRGLICTLLHRTFTICSDYKILHDEISKLKTIWQKNKFPLHFIDRCIKQFFNKLLVKKKAKKDNPQKKELSITLTFLGKQSLELKKKLLGIFHQYAPSVKLKFLFSSPYRLKNGFTSKE